MNKGVKYGLIALGASALAVTFYATAVGTVTFMEGIVRNREGDRNYQAERDKDKQPPENATEYRKLAWPYNKWLSEQDAERRHILSRDGLRLEAKLLKAKEPIGRTAIVCHGHKCCAGEEGFIVKMFSEAGYDVLAIDQRAHGASEGKLLGMGALEMYDVQRWTELIGAELPDQPIVLYGASMGAATVIMANSLKLHPNVKCVIEDCGYTTTYDVFLTKLKTDYPFLPLKKVIMFFSELLCRAFLGFDYKTFSPRNAVVGARLPMLFIHGKEDILVPPEMGEELYGACCSRRELFEVEGAGHNVSYFHATKEYTEKVMAFADSCIE